MIQKKIMAKNGAQIIKISVISLFGLVILSYTGFQANKIIRGPIIDIEFPKNGSTINSTLVEISGRAKNIAYINLNDRKIYTDTDGYFKEELLLSPGYNIIKLDAKDKFGSYTEEHLRLVLKEY